MFLLQFLMLNLMFIKIFNNKVKIFLYCIAFLFLRVSNTNYNLNDNREIMNCPKAEFFTIESLNANNLFQHFFIQNSFQMFAISKLQYRNNYSFLKLLLLLSGDVNVNPGPVHRVQDEIENKYEIFNKRGLHFLHINVNSLLPKIEEMRLIAKLSKATVIGISESKLDNTVPDSEVSIEGYNLLRYDRNRHGGGVACYVRNDICYSTKCIFSSLIENITIDILLPQSKPITIGILYRPPSQHDFLEKLSESLKSIKLEDNELYILGDLNYNLLQNGEYIFDNLRNSVTRTIASEIKHYMEFCAVFGLKQMIRSPTRITCSTSTLIDHILCNSDDKISQYGILDIGISDHHLIYCTRKIKKIKVNKHTQISFRSYKKYTLELYEDALRKINFPNYENFTNIDNAYSDFIDKLLSVIDVIAPNKTARVKNRTQEWFDGEILEMIAHRDKLSKKYKKSKLHIDKELFKQARNATLNLIRRKKKEYYEGKLKQNIGRPKELWKTLKSLGLPHKTAVSSNICLEENEKVVFETQSNANIFKTFFSSLANNLVSKLPDASKKFGLDSVKSYYKKLKLGDKKLQFEPINTEFILKILKNIDTSKAAGIDKISGRFLKDGASILSIPIAQICNLSISSSSFPQKCKIAKLKPLHKKGSKTDPKNYRPISLLPLVSKVIEKVIFDQTQTFLNENNILYKFQSGFRPNHSTDFCLSYLNDKILKGFDSGLLTGMILIDLQKAFDTIDHDILIKKCHFLVFLLKLYNGLSHI